MIVPHVEPTLYAALLGKMRQSVPQARGPAPLTLSAFDLPGLIRSARQRIASVARARAGFGRASAGLELGQARPCQRTSHFTRPV